MLKEIFIMNQVQYEKRNGFAIASFVISLAGLLVCFLIIPQILGIVFGLLGLKSEKKGLAIAGIAISTITFVLVIVLTLAIAIPNIIEAVDDAKTATHATIDDQAILVKSNTKVVDNPELAESMENLDKLAGIDKQSVLDNVSEAGKELIGAWGNENAEGGVDIVLLLNSDGTYKRYYKYPDESTILSGTWSYDGNRSLALNTTFAIEAGEDVMSKMDPNPTFEIYYFKDNVMKLRNMRTLNEFVYTKSELK